MEGQTNSLFEKLPFEPNTAAITNRKENTLAVITPDKGLYSINLNEVVAAHPELAEFDHATLCQLFKIVPPEALSEFGQGYSNPRIELI